MEAKAVMLDFDGTLTEMGAHTPSKEMVKTLVRLSKKMPFAVCTGRNLDSFVRRGLDLFKDQIPAEDLDQFLSQLHLVAENGALGYFYDPKAGEFKQFYEEQWPEKYISRDKLKTEIGELVTSYGELFENAHKVAVVYRTNLYGNEDSVIKEVYKLSRNIYEAAVKYLEEFDPGYEEYLHVGDSGIGVLVIPSNADKDSGIRHFSKYLQEEKGMQLSDNSREIVVIGDRPLPGGNDHFFLNGRDGTAYTVGDMVEGSEFPRAVMGPDGGRLLNSKGTIYLLNQLI